MLKKLLLFFAFVLAAPLLVSAQENEGLPASGLTPDSPFYFLEQAWENVGTFFTFNSEAKVQRYLKLAEERLAEVEALTEETGKSGQAEKALERYQKFIEKAAEKVKRVEKTEVRERVAEATGKHLNILERVLENAPEQAKEGLRNALEASQNGQEKALEALNEKDPGMAARKTMELAEKEIDRLREKTGQTDSEAAERASERYRKILNLGERFSENNDSLAEQMEEKLRLINERWDAIIEGTDGLPETVKAKLEQAREISTEQHLKALEGMAKNNPEKAVERFEDFTEKRLEKAADYLEKKDEKSAEGVLRIYEKYMTGGQNVSAALKEGLTEDREALLKRLRASATEQEGALRQINAQVSTQAREQVKNIIESVKETNAAYQERIRERLEIQAQNPIVQPEPNQSSGQTTPQSGANTGAGTSSNTGTMGR